MYFVCVTPACRVWHLGGAYLHLGQRWMPVSPCSTMWQQRQGCMVGQCTAFCQWIWNCSAHSCKKQEREGRNCWVLKGRLCYQASSTHSGSVFPSAGCFLTLTNACVMEAGPDSRCCKYTAGFTPRGRSQCLKETPAYSVCSLSQLTVKTTTHRAHLKGFRVFAILTPHHHHSHPPSA